MAIIHVLDKQTDMILGTLSLKNADYWGDERKDSLNNENTFDFIANAALEKSSLLEKRNRLLIQDEDSFFREFIIIYAEQYKRNEKEVRSNASFTDLAKAKVIGPQTLTGATSSTVAQLALSGTEWKLGQIDYTFIRTITIENHTNPLALLKLIASTFELEIRFRVEINGNKIVGRYVDLVKQIAGFEGKEIAFRKDLIGLKRKEDSSQIVTALLGIGPEKPDGARLTVLVEDKDALQRWGRNGQHLIEVCEPLSSNAEMTEDKLRSLTQNELEKRIDAIVSYEGEAATIEHIFGREHEKVRVGQTVRIKDDGYKPPLYLEARIQEVVISHSTKKIKSFKIGSFAEFRKKDLENEIQKIKDLIKTKADAARLEEIKNNVTYKAEIISRNGLIFKSGNINTVLEARVYQGANDITNVINSVAFRWRRISTNPTEDEIWNQNHSGGTKALLITSDDVKVRATFTCEIDIN